VSEARSAYQTALTRFDATSPYHSYVQAKLDAVGGPVSAAAGSAGATVPAGMSAPAAPATKPAPAPPK
jgi:hypothetical protein